MLICGFILFIILYFILLIFVLYQCHFVVKTENISKHFNHFIVYYLYYLLYILL